MIVGDFLKKILIIEDEVAISKVLRAYLRKAGYDTEVVDDGNIALDYFQIYHPDLILLDVMLPGKDGWEILTDIRHVSDCPVVMLTALGDTEHKLSGLNEGADDYITKPFVAEEVVARIQAVLRRYDRQAEVLRQFGSLKVYPEAHRVTLYETEVEITPRDLDVLLFLTAHPNRTYSREALIEEIWGWDYEGSDRAVDLSMKRLRKALKTWSASEGEIKTVRGLGYQFRAETNQY